MPWALRGLRNGVLTTRYPRRADGYGPSFRGAVRVLEPPGPAPGADAEHTGPPPLAGTCPTGAISEADGGARVDRGRCILCGRCVEARPDRFAFDPTVEVATLGPPPLVVPDGEAEPSRERVEAARAELARRTRALRRSVHIRHVDAGSDGSEEWEIAALANPVYDIHRLGVFFTASPRHADILLVTGAGTAGMAGPLRATWEATPDPKVVIAAGTDAISGGLVHPTYATRGGVGSILPVDVCVAGSPPSPFSLLHGILLAVGLVPPRGRAG